MLKQYSLRPAIKVIGPSIAYVPLNNGMYSVIETADIKITRGVTWSAHYQPRIDRYEACGTRDGRHVKMHKLITGFSLTDHANGNPLDNRRHNLREANRSQNAWNSKHRANNTTGFKGVMRHGNKYRMEIVYKRKRYTEYGFSSPEEAFARYCIRSAEMHGEFGRPTTSVTVPPPDVAAPVIEPGAKAVTK